MFKLEDWLGSFRSNTKSLTVLFGKGKVNSWEAEFNTTNQFKCRQFNRKTFLGKQPFEQVMFEAINFIRVVGE